LASLETEKSENSIGCKYNDVYHKLYTYSTRITTRIGHACIILLLLSFLFRIWRIKYTRARAHGESTYSPDKRYRPVGGVLLRTEAHDRIYIYMSDI